MPQGGSSVLREAWSPLLNRSRSRLLIDESVLASLDAMFGLDDLYARLEPLLQAQSSISPADEHQANILQALREHAPPGLRDQG
ncbi:hypothetical protein [Streptomyces nojiriensis]|uniref:hypothetical protein n=1 Tax=Streptomyces nojiriensis TaxID=66374 RepID=UPI0036786B5D